MAAMSAAASVTALAVLPRPQLAAVPSVPELELELDAIERRHSDLGMPHHRLLFFAALRRASDREVTTFNESVAVERIAELQDRHPDYELEDVAIVLLARGARIETLAAGAGEVTSEFRANIRARLRQVDLDPLLVEAARFSNVYANLGRGGTRSRSAA